MSSWHHIRLTSRIRLDNRHAKVPHHPADSWNRMGDGLKGNPVKIGSGPAAVIGDEICNMSLFGLSRMGRRRQ
jgi:hypothetical protein